MSDASEPRAVAADSPGWTPERLVELVRLRQPRAVGRAISIVERGGAEAAELLARLYPATGRAKIVGVTGPPGAGKSTLVDRLAQECRGRGETVGIVGVDPTSPFTGGALLGDRIRMQGLATDPGVFIRSMATRGALGGLARATRDAADLLDAAGFDWVLVETVGVGQDEIDVVSSVDSVLVVAVPGLGDDIQAIKAGIFEIADVFVLNTADRDGADRVVRDLEMMLSLGHPTRTRPWRGAPPAAASADSSAQGALEWAPPIVRTVASRGEGIADLLAAIERHRAHLETTGELALRRKDQLRLRVETILKDRVLSEARRDAHLDAAVERGFRERVDPYALAERLFTELVHAGASR
jgi:LAO/AO transport system kinase